MSITGGSGGNSGGARAAVDPSSVRTIWCGDGVGHGYRAGAERGVWSSGEEFDRRQWLGGPGKGIDGRTSEGENAGKEEGGKSRGSVGVGRLVGMAMATVVR